MQNIADRFPSLELIGAFDIFIPPLSNENEERLKSKSKENLDVLLAHYGDSLVDGGEVYKEWESFSVLLKEHYTGAKARDVLKDLASESLGLVYPQLAKLAQVCLVIPFTTADCERAFSSMNRIKTTLRNRLKTSTLDNLLRISIEGPELEDFDFDTAVNSWSAIRKRRIATH